MKSTPDGGMRVHPHGPDMMLVHVLPGRTVLHDPANSLLTWLKQAIGFHVSSLTECSYCGAGHRKNAAHPTQDPERVAEVGKALGNRRLRDSYGGAECARPKFAERLTLNPRRNSGSEVQSLKEASLHVGKIPEVNGSAVKYSEIPDLWGYSHKIQFVDCGRDFFMWALPARTCSLYCSWCES